MDFHIKQQIKDCIVSANRPIDSQRKPKEKTRACQTAMHEKSPAAAYSKAETNTFPVSAETSLDRLCI